MARPMTREERVTFEQLENVRLNKSELECSRGYCEALVDGEMAIEEAMSKLMTRAEAIDKAWRSTTNPKLVAEGIVDALEALGLIKFKPKLASPEDKFITLVNELPPSENGRAILRYLKQNGLTVVETKV